jgi:hypothetical protein
VSLLPTVAAASLTATERRARENSVEFEDMMQQAATEEERQLAALRGGDDEVAPTMFDGRGMARSFPGQSGIFDGRGLLRSVPEPLPPGHYVADASSVPDHGGVSARIGLLRELITQLDARKNHLLEAVVVRGDPEYPAAEREVAALTERRAELYSELCSLQRMVVVHSVPELPAVSVPSAAMRPAGAERTAASFAGAEAAAAAARMAVEAAGLRHELRAAHERLEAARAELVAERANAAAAREAWEQREAACERLLAERAELLRLASERAEHQERALEAAREREQLLSLAGVPALLALALPAAAGADGGAGGSAGGGAGGGNVSGSSAQCFGQGGSGASVRELALAETALSAAVARVRAEKDLVLVREEVERRLQQAAAAAAGDKVRGLDCVVCQDAERSVLILPCRHLCLCAACARSPALESPGAPCPICRAPIGAMYSVFAS